MMHTLSDVKIAVIGLGYVGLPLAVEFGKKYPTVGFDINSQRVEELKQGHDFTLEVSTDELADSAFISYACDIEALKASNVYIVTVPTPIDEHKQPDLTPLVKASEMLGKVVKKGDIIAEVTGPVRSLLMAERTALNFLGRMSGIATLTAQYVKAVEGTGVKIAATRKTTPGLRALEKRAVLAGGGQTHRQSLSDAIMIKDNHIALAGGIDAALAAIKSGADHMTRVSVEVDTLAQLERALPHHPHVVLLDNMGPEILRKAVGLVSQFDGPRPVLEASGGVDLTTVRGIAESGIDIISIGGLTHSAPNFDIGLDAA